MKPYMFEPNMTDEEFTILWVLSQFNDEGARIKDIGELHRLKMIRKNITQMIKKGWVEMLPVALTDKAAWYMITTKGRETLDMDFIHSAMTDVNT